MQITLRNTHLGFDFLQNVYEDGDSIHMVMELCEGGGILDRIKESPFTEKRVAFIIRSILRFIGQCHAKGTSAEPDLS